MNDLVASPFGASSRAITDTAGARQDQSRELAEVQVQYLMAQQFPRDPVQSMDRILNAFTRPTLAEKSQYQFSRGGSDIRGPSIKAMEAIAAEWGNIDVAWRERSRGVDTKGVPFSEVEAVAVDLQSRARKRIGFIVLHWRDTKKGGYKITDERDIYELCANMAQRRVRACIESLIPSDVTEAAMAQADATLHARADTSAEALEKMLDAFEPFGVTKEHIEKRIQRRLDAIQPAQVVSLKRIYASLRDGMSMAGEWFEMESGATAAAGETTTLKDIADKAAARKASNKQVKQEQQQSSDKNPIFDIVGFKDRMDKCTDTDVLDLLADEIRDVPEQQRTELEEHYRNRRTELAGD